jgi:hypothetical protein
LFNLDINKLFEENLYKKLVSKYTIGKLKVSFLRGRVKFPTDGDKAT